MNRRFFLQSVGCSLTGVGLFSFPLETYENTDIGNQVDKISRFGDGRDWFFEKRFGLFIHWGLYSIPGWQEQHQYRLNVPRKEYEKLMYQFNPIHYDPDSWLDLMEAAGMKYLCFTTKHIDGFCMWNTMQTDYKVTNTPYGKDVLEILANACKKRNIPLVLYYAIVDNHHKNYPNQGRMHELPGPEKSDEPDKEKYINYIRMQVKELCSNYGEIHGFWWDAPRLEYEDSSINSMIRKLQPNAVINDRGFGMGDFGTPERDYKNDDKRKFDRPVEACQSVGEQSWGYRVNEDYYTDRYLIRSIDRYLSRGANYLLNVGPDALGNIPLKSSTILRNIGEWYHSVSESFDEVDPASQLTSNQQIMLTKCDNILYVHLNNDPVSSAITLKPFRIAPQSAVLLNTKNNVEFILDAAPMTIGHSRNKENKYLRLINLPTNEMCNTVLVIKLEFDRNIEELL